MCNKIRFTYPTLRKLLVIKERARSFVPGTKQNFTEQKNRVYQDERDRNI